MQASWQDEYRQLIRDCRKRETKISAWDADFLDSISERLDDNRPLSPRQIEVLEGIWERATRNG